MCLAKKKIPLSHEEDVKRAVEAIAAFLQDGKKHRLTDLKTLPFQAVVLDEALRYMTAEELLIVKDLNVSLNSKS